MDHLLVACVFARGVWHKVLVAWGGTMGHPGPEDRLLPWLTSCVEGFTHHRRDGEAILCLVAWELWKHRNAIVFDKARPSEGVVMARIVDESKAWVEARLLREGALAFHQRLCALYTWVSSE